MKKMQSTTTPIYWSTATVQSHCDARQRIVMHALWCGCNHCSGTAARTEGIWGTFDQCDDVDSVLSRAFDGLSAF